MVPLAPPRGVGVLVKISGTEVAITAERPGPVHRTTNVVTYFRDAYMTLILCTRLKRCLPMCF